MTAPPGKLDARFSAESATAVSWHDVEEVLASASVFSATTVRPDGRPHVSPLVAVWHDDTLYFCTGDGEQKRHNVDANPRVALAVANDEWRSGLDVVVEGIAARVDDPATLRELAAEWLTKWDGQWRYDVVDGGFAAKHGVARVYAVSPTKVLAFGKDPFAQTTFRFR